MKRILSFGQAEIALRREESDGSCLGCFFNDVKEGCARYYKYKVIGGFECEETTDYGEEDEDGELITYTDYFIWTRQRVLDKCTVVI